MTVSLPLAKQHLRVDHDDENALITAYLAAAVAWVENYTGKKLTRGAVTQEESAFGCYITLFRGPAPASVTVAYTDSDGAGQTIADGLVVKNRLYPNETWPSIATNTPITVTYTAGYTLTPSDLDNAVLLLVGHWYANREAVNVGNIVAELPFAVEALCRPYRDVLV
jgi:uncharacterized phiE125 gp8 family phage protein